MGKLLRVNLTSGQINVEDISPQLQRDYLGPRGFAVRYLFDELSPGIDPLSPENVIFMGAGALAGIPGLNFSKWLVGTKSPLSGGYARSVCGGRFGALLKFAGFDAITIEGCAARPSYIFINKGEVSIYDAAELWGMDTDRTQEWLKQKYNSQISVACIGPGGEKLVRYACIVSDRRTAGRCGTGTVMASKNLKAIAINASGHINPYDPEILKGLSRKLIDIHKADFRNRRYSEYGSASLLERFAYKSNITPVRNFQGASLEGVDKLFSTEFNKYKVRKYGCWGCMTRCGQFRQVTEGPYAGHLTDGPEYESIAALGCVLGNNEPASIIAMDELCDLYGIDTISTGVCIGFACELYERGVITSEDTDGLELTWGNHQAFLRLVHKIGKREGFGWLLGEGTKRAAEQIGKGAGYYAMQVKGVEIPGEDPRTVKGLALGFAVSNIGAHHMYGWPTKEFYGEIDRLVDEGHGAYIAQVQKDHAIRDCIMECIFGDSGLSEELRGQMLIAATGFEELGDVNHVDDIGGKIVTLERAFNVREGFSRKDDTLPLRFLTEPIKNAGRATGETVRKLDTLLDEYYAAMGYNIDGIPVNKGE